MPEYAILPSSEVSDSDAGKPITVLDLRDSPWVDGPGRTILDCAETIDPTVCRIVVCAFDGGLQDGTSYEEEARRRGLLVERIHERRSLDARVLKQILDLVKKHDADILHSHDFRTDLFGLLAAKLLGKPLVSTVHGWIANTPKGRLSTRLDQVLLRFSSHIISVSDETRRRLGKWAREDRCTVISNALRTEKYHPQKGRGLFRSSNGIEDGEILIANIGRLSPEKGQMPFLEAARVLLEQHDGLRFVLFGTGPDQCLLEDFVDQHDMGEAVIFAGYRTDMDQIYNEIDLVVQSSYTEGMPNVILEALLMEVPVIATSVGGTGEVVKDGETGILIPPGEHASLVNAISDFVRQRNRFADMARRGRSDVLDRFDHRRRVERLVSVYRAHAGLPQGGR
ncbi:Glycosyltransferase-like protein [Thioalkalivibrio sulfidiphilus HL-EbGr7]|uniref:Glycosyltransferase-like protein n=1 Tax=Thioalkalivibrio sulfidiphilus (strain HL-EbGR7) TaxID=396588 RepID=B8GV96_THISH|nr:glycosyltransferase family 4 protein [Thioalkalivibrio sulfidiphilus]ACL73442.1 Glycosyltransferase-like protein [Thioalkalivibrio sulfidiphilus HL-EbGr7]